MTSVRWSRLILVGLLAGLVGCAEGAVARQEGAGDARVGADGAGGMGGGAGGLGGGAGGMGGMGGLGGQGGAGGCADEARRPCTSACGEGEEACENGTFGRCNAPLADADGQCPDGCTEAARRPDAEQRVDRGPDPAWFPALTPFMGGFVLAWGDHRDGPAGTTWVQRLTAAGAPTGEPVRVADRFFDALVPAGDRLAVITVEVSRLAYSAVKAGEVEVGPVLLDDLGSVALHAATWTGQHVALLYDRFQQEGSERIYLALADLQGRVVTQDVLLVPSVRLLSVAVQRLPDGYLVAWAEPHEGDPFAPDLFLARFNNAGERLGSTRTLTRGRDAVFAAGPAGFGLAFVAHRAGQPDAIGFQALSPVGEPAGAPVLLSDSPANARDPALAWSGSRYGVVWVDGRDPGPDLWFRPLAADGTPQAAPARLVTQTGNESSPVLVYGENRFALAWFRTRDDDFTEVWSTTGPFLCE